MDRRDSLTAKTLLNLVHSLGLDSSRSDRLLAEVVYKYEKNPENFDLADLSQLAHKSLQYFEDRHVRTVFKNKDKEVAEPKFEEVEQDLQIVVDRVNSIFVRAMALRDQMNMLDLKQLYDSIRLFSEIVSECTGLSTQEILAKYPSIGALLSAIFENTQTFKQSLEVSDLKILVRGLPVVAEVQTEESIEFVKEIKYRLKKALEKNRPQGAIDDMKRYIRKLHDHQVLYKTFRAILD